MKLKELEEALKFFREQGASDDTNISIYNGWTDVAWDPLEDLQYCTYDPEVDDEEYDPTLVLYGHNLSKM